MFRQAALVGMLLTDVLAVAALAAADGHGGAYRAAQTDQAPLVRDIDVGFLMNCCFRATRPNVLLIHIDDLNDWVYRPEGHPRAITPNIDRLRAGGVSFVNAHAVVPVCGPSRKCLYSGWYHIGEKDCIQKWHLWEESTRVPLIVRLPGGPAGGSTCDQPVSHIDLYPTLVDVCALPTRPHAAAPLDGHSLRPLLADPRRGQWTGPSVTFSGISDSDNHEAHYSVRSKRYRYTLCANGEEELYDHQADPNEWTNRAGDPALMEVKAGLRAELEKILKATRKAEGSQS